MPNRVVLNKLGLIVHSYDGNQSATALSHMVEQNNVFVRQLEAKGQSVLILMDFNKLGKLSITTRRIAVRAMHEMRYQRIAIFGANTFNKALINLIAYSAHKTHAVHVFDTRADAVRWLEGYGRP